MNFCYVITFFRLGFFLPSPELVYMWFRQRHIPGSVVACFFNSRFCKRSVFFLFLSIFIFCYVISKFCEVVIVILALFYRASPCSAFLPGFFQDTGCITNFINDDAMYGIWVFLDISDRLNPLCLIYSETLCVAPSISAPPF